jgi:hypothetical protein
MERAKVFLSNLLPAPTSFTSPSLQERDKRLKTTKREAEHRCQRLLSQDLHKLNRKEGSLATQLRALAAAGDYPKAHILAKQIAAMRDLADRNFAAGAAISQQAFCAASNQAILRARVEAIKGLTYANRGEGWKGAARREQKYTKRLDEFVSLEAMRRGGLVLLVLLLRVLHIPSMTCIR